MEEKHLIKKLTNAKIRKRKLDNTECNGRNKKVKNEDAIEIDEKKIVEVEVGHCSSSETKFQEGWKEYILLAEQHNLDVTVAKSIVKLFEDGNTIPFIARYRRDLSNNMSPEELREVKDSYDSICALKSKIQTVLKNVEKTGKLDSTIKYSIINARSAEELEYIYSPFKPGSKRTLAQRAKELGLEEPALKLLENTEKVELNQYIDLSNSELKTIKLVEVGVIHIIASIIATDTDVLTFLRKLRSEVNFLIETKRAKNTAKTAIKKEKENVDESKFENYFDYKIPVKYIKPHQVLAINRGEVQKILSVKVVVPDWVSNKFTHFCTNKWMEKGRFNENRKRIISEAISDSYTRLVQPLIIREIRAELKSKAEKASYDVFSTNLKQLLLTQPIKCRCILAIDPGFANGCKMAIVSETGIVLDYDVIYPHKGQKKKAEELLKNLLKKHNCSIIALGNGTACRETEEWISTLIQKQTFLPLDVTYTIVNENGASIYSCSTEAKKEFPDLDPNIVSAVSLARRVQDPLAELVKVEPKHLGVGMYQHDLKKKQLEEALDEVVSECVSFVGVDLNTASQCLLRRVAGLTDKRAKQIIDYREKHGIFISRMQLLNIKLIGKQTFQQCIGFLRVGPTCMSKDFYKLSETNRLDCTYIHVESYKIAEKLIKKLGLKVEDIGQDSFINTVKTKTVNIADLSTALNSTEETVKLILDALSKPLNYDLRVDYNQIPLFKKGLTNITDLTRNTILTGRVSNVTHFGCFVDIGVGINGLIHSSKMNGINLQIGDRVEVKVLDIEMERKRIQLQTVKKL